MTYPPHINSLSIQSVYLEVLFPDPSKTSPATGFFIRDGCGSQVVYLATARHVLHGSDFFTKDWISTPQEIRVWIPLTNRIGWRAFEIALRDENGDPKWIDHETVNALTIDQTLPDADVALLPLKLDDAWREALVLPYVPCERDFFADWQRSIGMNLYVCGFPLRRTAQKLAVTIIASVASEPNLDFHYCEKYFPFYLVSGRTWSGQSGSPVVPWPSVGAGSTGSGQWRYAAGAGPSVVGLYSGRLKLHETETSDLGIVWHADLLSQLAATYSGVGHSVEWT
jgi:hypothetical protein